MKLIDSHCHLDFPQLQTDCSAVLNRARDVGVVRFLTISTHITKRAQVQAVAEQHPDVYFTIGVHPHHVAEPDEYVTTSDLITMANHPKLAALGETGLDYYYDHAPRPTQQESFRQHLRAAAKTGLPVIVHSREAETDTATIIAEEQTRAGGASHLRGVMHCFSSKRELADAALAMGFYISVSGMITFKKSDDLRAIIADVPLDRLLVETDSPYLAPVPHRGQTCEPAFVADTARALADIKGVSMAEIAAITTANFYRLFTRVLP